jgi:hypothetical protein
MSENTEDKREYQDKPGGQFKKGNPGKPLGARHMTTLLKEAIVRVAEGEELADDLLIVKNTIDSAKKGDPKSRDLIWNYLDGKPAQSKDDPGGEDNPMHMTVTIKKL